MDAPSVSFDLRRAEAAVRELLLAVGEDPGRDGLLDTPARVARSYLELLSGYHEDPGRHLERQFTIDHEEMVIVKDIPFSSMCEHHMLPFMGRAHVAYLPSATGKVCGLSKIARLVDGYARRLQVQERLTGQVADDLMDRLGASGALVILEAEHLCMTIRGAMKPGALTTTSAVRGSLTDQSSRAEALSLIMSGR
ncbi:MAG: GTP cyclohydrolase I FolE [Acidimicrobiia bacterium]|nr:GTP cyclohydrolase I FolE [Acidimicrobiia bacterium]MDH5291996.1 GTP cyclohydrolase I FolE [Acidimicrobiia bacterium]